MAEKGIDIGKLLNDLLDAHEAEIESRKTILAEVETAKSSKQKPNPGKKYSRYISVGIKKVLKDEYGDKCSFPNCTKLAQQIHHQQRFALTSSHNPKFLKPLCRDHHQIEHAIDVKYFETRQRIIGQ